jgi:hypothetical protein
MRINESSEAGDRGSPRRSARAKDNPGYSSDLARRGRPTLASSLAGVVAALCSPHHAFEVTTGNALGLALRSGGWARQTPTSSVTAKKYRHSAH